MEYPDAQRRAMITEKAAGRHEAAELWYAYCCAYLLHGLALGGGNDACLVGVVLVVL